jgi:hypothetical protein
MKIYVASSWRNIHQQTVVSELRKDGHEVYDYKNNPGVFRWEDIDPNYLSWSYNPDNFIKGLEHPLAKKGFECDMNALIECHAVVYVMPCGPSASMELGYAVAANKLTIVYIPDLKDPDLMIKMADFITTEMEDVKFILNLHPKQIPSYKVNFKNGHKDIVDPILSNDPRKSLGENWLYKRLEQASNMVDSWDEQRKNSINYVWKEKDNE